MASFQSAAASAFFEAAKEPKKFHKIINGGHNNLYDFPVVAEIRVFLDKLDASGD